ncbi:MAG: hypothetical protein AAF533_28665 [Acidobacteriota bacterium]
MLRALVPCLFSCFLASAALAQGWSFDLELGARQDDRSSHQFGELTTDSSSFSRHGRPGVDTDDTGFGCRFGVTRHLSNGNAISFSLAIDQFDDRGTFRHDAGSRDVLFQLPFIDGPGVQDTSRLDGDTVGFALREAFSEVDHESDELELGIDWVRPIFGDGRGMSLAVGIRYADHDIDDRIEVAGTESTGAATHFSSIVHRIDERFLGARVGLDGRREFGNRSRLHWNVAVSALHRDSDYDGVQHVLNDTGAYAVIGDGNDDDWTGRIEAGIGIDWEVGDAVFLGLGYSLEWWSDVAVIRTPQVEVVPGASLTPAVLPTSVLTATDESRIDTDDRIVHHLGVTLSWGHGGL